MTDAELIAKVVDDLASIYAEHTFATTVEETLSMSFDEAMRVSRAVATGIDHDEVTRVASILTEETSDLLIRMGPSHVHAAVAAMWTSGFIVGTHFQRRRAEAAGGGVGNGDGRSQIQNQ